MAYDPQREDYQRLGLRFATSLDGMDARQATRSFATFGRRFAQQRDSLPQSDADRAFHLVAMATKLIDYQLPFADDDQAKVLVATGHKLLDEAIALDAHCYDAIRMKSASEMTSFESFLDYLHDRDPEVKAHCKEQQRRFVSNSYGERARLYADLTMRPYVRWVSTQAEHALICGRNKEALSLAYACLELDVHDFADARFTAALAFAKLEDEAGFDALEARLKALGTVRPANDPWALIARLCLCFKAFDHFGTEHWLKEILGSFPRAAEALIRQIELPVGVFARLATLPYSEDELILAISEATVLLQEGVDPMGKGTLSTWLYNEVSQRNPEALLAVMAEQRDKQGGQEA